MEIHGYCDEKFAGVREVLECNFRENGDLGASVAATVEGEFVVDIWGGYEDAARTRPWQENTIVNVYSTTKTMTFITALMMEDRGLLDIEAPVSDYWPEFAQAGKEGICVRHVLSHSAGLPGFSRRLSPAELYDWDLVCADLASQEPWWQVGTQCGYHGFTQGFLIGEVVRRITGKSFGTYFKEEIADRVGADFHIGLDPRDFGRIADLQESPAAEPPTAMDPESIIARVYGSLEFESDTPSTEDWRRAEIPAANGHGNARSVVRAQTALANGGKAFGTEFFSPKAVSRALQTQIKGNDLVIGFEVEYAMGYSKPVDWNPLSPNANSLWWGGAGGSTICVDTDAHVCMSYVMNQMSTYLLGDPRGISLHQALYAGLMS
ncbi:MAG: serine hydrolase [Gammaproteobacteria bacterium]|nr:serine hydrolase [Gammaproteobacteria bacterium]